MPGPGFSKFYRVANVFLTSGADLGPFPGFATTGSFLSLLRAFGGDANTPSPQRTQLMFDCIARAVKFPGVFHVERPSSGSFTAATVAGTTNHALVTLNDGQNPAVVFEFDKGGGVTPGNEQIDLTGGQVTAAEVATAIVAAINAYTVALADGLGGWFASANGADVSIVQTGGSQTGGNPKMAGSRSWFFATYAQLGNIAIINGAGTGLTNVVGMTGGVNRGPGVICVSGGPNHRRPTFLPVYYAPIVEEE